MSHACGKVILTGEHAVVYGVPAIAAGIERGVHATASLGAGTALTIGSRVTHREEALGQAYAALLAELNVDSVTVRAHSNLPSGVGLGGSAALGVAVARAVAELVPSISDSQLLLATAAWEQVFHGTASGVDAACALSGGCIRFVRDQGFSQIPIGGDLHLAIAIAGPASSTKEMVASVARYKERKPALFEQTLRAIETLVANAEQCLIAGDTQGLGKLMDYNQMLLAGLMCSTPELEAACALAREAGAYGAKLTGAGGGGCVVAVCGGSGADPILAAWKKRKIEGFATVVRAH